MKIILETARLQLREMEQSDVPFIASLLGDPEVTRFYPQVYGLSDAEAWVGRQIERYRRDGHGLWLVVDRATTQPIGQTGLVNQLIEGNFEPEIGYMIHSKFWRQGLATEAALWVRDHAFGVLGKKHVISLIRPINHPSRGVAAKLGMRPLKLTLHGGLEHLIYEGMRDEG
jgi:RimJ/RimL family protein N-acetyltransferase